MNKAILIKTKKDIVDRLYATEQFTKKQATDAVNLVFEEIAETLQNGGELTINGFGKFDVTTRAARTGINPSTMEKIEIAETKSPRFKASKALKDAVKGA